MGLGLAGYIPLAVYVLGLGVAALVLFWRTELGLYFLVPLLPLENVLSKVDRYPAGKDLVDILVAAMVIGWVVRGLGKKERIFAKTPLNLPILLLAGTSYIALWRGSSFLGLDPPLALGDPRLMNWKNYMILPLLYLITVNNVKSVKQIMLLVLLMAGSMILMDFFFYNELRWVKTWHYSHKMRIEGSFRYLSANSIAAFYAEYSLVLLGLIFFDKLKRRRLLFMMILLANTYCLMFSFSRGAYLAGLVGGIFVLFVARRKYLPLLFALALGGLFVAPRVLPVSVVERIDMTMEKENDGVGGDAKFDSSAEARLDFWAYAIDVFKANPVFGRGFDTFIRSHPERMDTHNMYLNVLAEMGLVGGTILMLLFFLSFRDGWKLYRVSEERFLRGLGLGFSGCVIACMISNIFGNRWTYVPLSTYYWVFWGLVMRGRILAQEKSAGWELQETGENT